MGEFVDGIVQCPLVERQRVHDAEEYQVHVRRRLTIGLSGQDGNRNEIAKGAEHNQDDGKNTSDDEFPDLIRSGVLFQYPRCHVFSPTASLLGAMRLFLRSSSVIFSFSLTVRAHLRFLID